MTTATKDITREAEAVETQPAIDESELKQGLGAVAPVSPNSALRALASQVPVAGRAGLQPKTLAEIMDFAQLMAKAGPMVGKSFRGNPGACMGIAMQAFRWGMDPFAVSQKAYVTEGKKEGEETIGYEAQLVNAVILANAPLQGRPTYRYEGEGGARRCTVIAMLRGESMPLDYTTPPLSQLIPRTNEKGHLKGSYLWKTDADQQLGYYAIRAWARRHCPEIIMGVYTIDEMQTIEGDYRRVPDEAPRLADAGAISHEDVSKLRDKLEAAGADEEKFCAFLGVARLDELPKARVDFAAKAIEARAKANGRAANVDG